MKILPIILVSCFLNLPTNAATSLNDCTVDSATSQEAFSIIKEEGEISKVSLPLLQQILDLLKSYPNSSNKPLIEIMSAKDIIKYTEIRSKLLFTSAQGYIISEHDRDIRAIAVMWNIAFNKVDTSPIPITQYDNGVLLERVLGAITLELEGQSVTITIPESSSYCTAPMAISVAENKLIQMTKLQAKSVNS